MSSSKISQIIKSFQNFLKGMLQSQEITLYLTQRIEIMLFYVNRYPLDSDKMELFSNNSSSNEFLEMFIKENSLDVLIFSVKEILSQKATNQKAQPTQADLQSPKIEIQLSQNEQVIKDYIKNMISSKDQRQNQSQIQSEQNMDFGNQQNQIQSPLIIENQSLQHMTQEEFNDEIDSLNNRFNPSSQGSQKILNEQTNLNNNYLASSDSLQKNFLKSGSASQNIFKSNDPSYNQLDSLLNDAKNKQNEAVTQNYSMNRCSSQTALANQIDMSQNEKYQNSYQENLIGQYQQNKNQISNDFLQELQKFDVNQTQVNQNANYFGSFAITSKTNVGDSTAQNDQQYGNNQYNYSQKNSSFQQHVLENQEEFKKSLNHLLQDVKSNLQIMKNHTAQYNNLIQEYHEKNSQQNVQTKQDLAEKYQYNFKTSGQIENKNLDLNQQMKKSLKNVILYTRRDSIKASFYSIESDLQKKLQQAKHYFKHNNEKRSYINADETQTNQRFTRGQQIESLSQRYMLNRQKSSNSPQKQNQNNSNLLVNSNSSQQQKNDQQVNYGINSQPQVIHNQFLLNSGSQSNENQELNQYLANSPQQQHIFNEVQQQSNNQQFPLSKQILRQQDDYELNFATKNESNLLVNQQASLKINSLQQQKNGFNYSQGQSMQIPQIQQQLIAFQQQQTTQNQDLQKNELNSQYIQATQQQFQPAIYSQQQVQNQEQQKNGIYYYEAQQFITPQIIQSPVIFQEKHFQKSEQLKNDFQNEQIQQLQIPQIQQKITGYQQQQLQDQEQLKNDFNNYQAQQIQAAQQQEQPVICQQQAQNNEQIYELSQNQELILQQQSPVQVQQQQNILQQMQLQQTNEQQYHSPILNNQRRFQTEIHRNPKTNKNMPDYQQNSFIENIYDNNQNQLNTIPIELFKYQKNITESEKTNQTNDQQNMLKNMLKKYNQNQISQQRNLGNNYSPSKQLQNIYSLENVLQQTAYKNNNPNAVSVLQQNQQINSQNEQFTEKNKFQIQDQQIY
ncbi:hypothetical protein ABPG72_018816 [Tetrahymena utriculariae]